MESEQHAPIGGWFKSSYSGDDNTNCVEVADLAPDSVGVRDSKDTSRTPVTLPKEVWDAFIAHLQEHERR